MKKVNKVTMTLLNSPNANLTVNFEAQFQRRNQAGDQITNTYISPNGTAVINPNVYLVFTYKSTTGDYRDDRSIYASYPNLVSLENAVDKMQKYIAEGYGNIDGALVVRPEYTESILVSDIGKNNHFIEFKLIVSQTTENGIVQTFPAVQVGLSTAEGYVSVLTIREFDALTAIIKRTNLADLQLKAAEMFLSSSDDAVAQPTYSARPAAAYPAQPQQPRYGNRQYQQPERPQANYNRPAQNGFNNGLAERGMGDATELSSYARPAQPLPPRTENKPVINMNAVNNVPMEDLDFDDTDAVNAIFNDEE